MDFDPEKVIPVVSMRIEKRFFAGFLNKSC
jgi:hypothetical protein